VVTSPSGERRSPLQHRRSRGFLPDRSGENTRCLSRSEGKGLRHPPTQPAYGDCHAGGVHTIQHRFPEESSSGQDAGPVPVKRNQARQGTLIHLGKLVRRPGNPGARQGRTVQPGGIELAQSRVDRGQRRDRPANTDDSRHLGKPADVDGEDRLGRSATVVIGAVLRESRPSPSPLPGSPRGTTGDQPDLACLWANDLCRSTAHVNDKGEPVAGTQSVCRTGRCQHPFLPGRQHHDRVSCCPAQAFHNPATIRRVANRRRAYDRRPLAGVAISVSVKLLHCPEGAIDRSRQDPVIPSGGIGQIKSVPFLEKRLQATSADFGNQEQS